MKTETSAATSEGTPQGETKQAPAEDHVKTEDGLSKTKDWWWEDAPVDS